MIVEFLIACFLATSTDVKQAIIDLLVGVFENYDNDFDESVISEMVILRHRRLGEETQDARRYTIIGFALELPEETDSPERVIDSVVEELSNTEQGFHVLRFEDPTLQVQLAEYSDQIFQLEMKLRRVLSIIYLHAYQNRNPYDLLRMARVSIQGSPTEQEMKDANENQFFHILFSDYIRVNERKAPSSNVGDMLNLVRDSERYEDFRNEILRTDVIDDQQDADFLAEIKRNLQPIESMRNCVAHYRRPSGRIIDNYINARNGLNERLDQYLTQWKI